MLWHRKLRAFGKLGLPYPTGAALPNRCVQRLQESSSFLPRHGLAAQTNRSKSTRFSQIPATTLGKSQLPTSPPAIFLRLAAELLENIHGVYTPSNMPCGILSTPPMEDDWRNALWQNFAKRTCRVSSNSQDARFASQLLCDWLQRSWEIHGLSTCSGRFSRSTPAELQVFSRLQGCCKNTHAPVEFSPGTPAELREILSGDVALCNFSANGCRAAEKYTRFRSALAEFSPSAPVELGIFSIRAVGPTTSLRLDLKIHAFSTTSTVRSVHFLACVIAGMAGHN